MAMNYTSSGPVGGVAFLAYPSSIMTDLAVTTEHTVGFGNEVFDQGSNFASNTFTAPVSGQYHLNFGTWIQYMDSGADYFHWKIITSNRAYTVIYSMNRFSGDLTYMTLYISSLAEMDASDTAYCGLYQAGGSPQADVNASQTFFSGCLVA